MVSLNGNEGGKREIKREMIILAGQLGSEVSENKNLVKMYHVQLTGNVRLEFHKQRSLGGYRFRRL